LYDVILQLVVALLLYETSLLIVDLLLTIEWQLRVKLLMTVEWLQNEASLLTFEMAVAASGSAGGQEEED